MQQRFCSCGCAVWAQYQFFSLNCRVIFRSSDGSMEDYLTRCPSCGKQLNINELFSFQPVNLHSHSMEAMEG